MGSVEPQEQGAIFDEFHTPCASDDDDFVGMGLAIAMGPDGPAPLLLFTIPTFGIPAPQSSDDELGIADFDVLPRRPVHATLLRSSPAGALVVLATSIVALWPAPTFAAAPKVQRPATAPALPPEDAPASEPAAPEPAPTEAAPAATTPADPFAPEALATDPAKPPDDEVVLRPDLALDDLRGARVTVTLEDGTKVTGSLYGARPQTFTVVLDDGQVRVMRRSAVTDVRVTEVTVPTQNGIGMLVVGGLLVGVGVPVLISGLVFLGITPAYPVIWAPQVVIGGAATGGGITLIVYGTRRRVRFTEALSKRNRLALRDRPQRVQWTGGMSFRF